MPSGEVKEVVIFNKDYANIYLTDEALKSDKYKDLPKTYGSGQAKGPQFKVVFVDAANFEKTFNEVADTHNLDIPLRKEVPNSFFGDLFAWLPLILMIVFFVWMMRRMAGGGMVEPAVDVRLQMLGPEAHRERLAFQRHALPVQHGKGVPGAVAHRQDHLGTLQHFLA